MQKSIAEPRIQEFCALINQGIEAWTKAGQLLCEIKKDDPDAYYKILRSNPHLTRDILLSFERIGRKEIYPYLLIDGSPGAKLLCGLPYDAQVKIYSEQVLLAVKTPKGWQRENKRVCDLSAREATRVFDLNRIRSFDEQKQFLAATCKPHVYHTSRSPEPNNSQHDDLNETPQHELTRLLATANDAIVEARSALAILKLGNNAQCDRLITACLNYLGNLRYQVNELLK